MSISLLKNQYVVSIVKKGSTILFGFIAMALLSRAMGPTIKGEYDTYMNVVNILNIVLYLGVSTIYPNYVRNKEQWTESTFIAFVVLQFFVYCFIVLGLFIFSRKIMITLASLCIACSVLSIHLNNISLVEDYIWNAYANIASVFINGVLALIVFMMKWGRVELVMLVYCVKEITLSLFVIISLKNRFHIRFIDFSKMCELIKRGFVPMLTTLLVVVNYRIDVVFLKFYHVPYYEIGLYTSGLGIAEYAWIIPDVFKDVLINKTARSDNLKSVKFCLRASSTFLIMAYFILLIAGRYAIIALYGMEYVEAYKVTNLVFVGVYGMVYCKLLGTLYLAQGKWNFYCFTLLGAVAINVISNNLFIPLMGIYGAAITTIVAYSFAGMVFLLSFKKKYHFRFLELVIMNKEDLNIVKIFIQSKRKTKSK